MNSMDEHERELLEHIAEQREALCVLEDAGDDDEIALVGDVLKPRLVCGTSSARDEFDHSNAAIVASSCRCERRYWAP